jgi:hypothetical protein
MLCTLFISNHDHHAQSTAQSSHAPAEPFFLRPHGSGARPCPNSVKINAPACSNTGATRRRRQACIVDRPASSTGLHRRQASIVDRPASSIGQHRRQASVPGRFWLRCCIIQRPASPSGPRRYAVIPTGWTPLSTASAVAVHRRQAPWPCQRELRAPTSAALTVGTLNRSAWVCRGITPAG